ncbi:MAG TPA: hypothetical protein PK359_17195 [Burkholderiaceae bacterium]|jgi:hypothetical protein|nr:hypothetical protein [Burkholderiaceae bacterium]
MAPVIPIANDHPLSTRERTVLRLLAALMIPASTRHGVPGADDDRIFSDILDTLRPQAARISEMLQSLDTLAGQPFDTLDPAQQRSIADVFRKNRSPGLAAAVSATVQCYYRDDRVMHSLGMEARPPFPGGFEVEQGDWSLLDPVRERPPLYRKAP